MRRCADSGIVSGRRGSKPPSEGAALGLRSRLTLSFALVALVAVSIGGAVLYGALRREVIARTADQLLIETRMAVDLLSAGRSGSRSVSAPTWRCGSR